MTTILYFLVIAAVMLGLSRVLSGFEVRGWGPAFWAALVLFGLGGLGAFGNLGTLARPSTSPIPIAAVAVSELLSVASLALFVWLLVGLIKFGPWAMKKPGA